MESHKVVYTPDYRLKKGWFGTWATMFRNMWNSRELIVQLFRRDFFMTYRKSFLGLGWVFLGPIIGIVSWVFMNMTGILNPGDVGIPYPAYVLISSSIWGLFMGFYGSAAGTLGAGAGFIMQVNYPHEVLLVKQLAQFLANFSITFFMNILLLLLFGVVPSVAIVLFPIIIIPMMLLAAAMGLILSVVSVVASDLSNIFNTGLGLVFYATPIIYSSAQQESNFLRTVNELNPLTYLVAGVRDVIIYGTLPRLDIFLFWTVAAALLFLLAMRLFYVSEHRVIERMI